MEPDIINKIEGWRIKAASGSLTLEEMRGGIEYLRQNRTKATIKAKEKGKSKKVINSNELLSELEGL